jgi:hypothetical protein
MKCATEEALLKDFFVAAKEYIGAAHRLSKLVSSHDEFRAARWDAKQTRLKCRAARVRLEKHRVEHRCTLSLEFSYYPFVD